MSKSPLLSGAAQKRWPAAVSERTQACCAVKALTLVLRIRWFVPAGLDNGPLVTRDIHTPKSGFREHVAACLRFLQKGSISTETEKRGLLLERASFILRNYTAEVSKRCELMGILN